MQGVELINTSIVQLHIPGLERTVPVTQEMYMVDELDVLWVNLDPKRFLQPEIRNAVKAAMNDFSGRKYMSPEFGAPPWWTKKTYCYGFPLDARNQFTLKYLTGANPYEKYELEDKVFTPQRDCMYQHQSDMFNFILNKRYCIIAAEMGTGKSLSILESLEWMRINEGLKNSEIVYVAPVSGVRSIKLEFEKWKSPIRPSRVVTYEGMAKMMRLWENGDTAPKAVIFDESSKLKTWTAKRTKAAYKLASAIRAEHGDKGLCVQMSGTPAPKTPVDWWSQAEVACAGFIAESTPEKFRNRLCIREQREGMAGGSYSHIVTFLDNEEKCRCCGMFENHMNHKKDYDSEILPFIPKVWPPVLAYGQEMPKIGKHVFERSINEVEHLSKRLDGLAQVTYKKDCLDLPDKQYRIVRVKPTPASLQAVTMIKKTSRSVITALIKLRELSDGFNYVQKDTGKLVDCTVCNGTGKVEGILKEEADDSEIMMLAPNIQMDGYTEAEVECDACGGDGKVTQYKRDISEVECPKDDVLKDYLDDQEDIGRMVVWGAFTGTLERISAICRQKGWNVLKVEGRGWKVEMADPNEEAPSVETALKCMDASHPDKLGLFDQYDKFVVVGNPMAGGMGLTLTAAQVALYYSNPFSGEARIQSEDRIHRTGMDKNRAPIIVDIVHLSSDKVVIDNLKRKRRLQDMSMGELVSQIDTAREEVIMHGRD